MAWPKIKNIIILILLGTNLCLLAFNLSREVRSYQLEEEARSNTIAFLQQKGIQLEESQVPRAVSVQPQRVTRDVEGECVLAAALLEGAVSVEARGAEVYRYYNENGSIQFHSNGEFYAQFTPGAFPVKDGDWEEHARQVLLRLEFPGELLERKGGPESGALVFREMWEDVPLLTCQASLNYENGSLVSITSGRRLVGEPEEDNSGQSITVATALMKFYTGLSELGDVCSQISAIVQAYTVTSTLSDPMPLTPVWYITTDTGAYQLDTLNGSLSRAS